MWYLVTALLSGIFSLSLYYFFTGRKREQLLHKILQNILQLRSSTAVAKNKYFPKDIVEQINNELLLWEKEHKEQIEKLKHTESYRKEFLSNVSHELKTPIFATQGFIHTLIDGGIDDADVNIVYLNKAGKSLDRLISIVDDLEAISKIESGELSLEMRTFDLVDLINDVIDSLEIAAREKKITLTANVEIDKQVYVLADKERIRQVLVNLIVNSIKYGKENGKAEISIAETDGLVWVEIKDDGIGIEENHLPRLFERFYRVDKHRSRAEGGTGLGLAIVKHIVEAHQQRIHVSSVFSQGTVFTFSLKKSN